jgi:5-methylthioadenosine/S-adenosylhomocysteine deaminase
MNLGKGLLSYVARIAAGAVIMSGMTPVGAQSPPTVDTSRGLVLRGTIVTMNDQHAVIKNGSLLVRDGRIVAVWRDEQTPGGILLNGATVIDLGPHALIFPGMINLHNHPTYDVLRLWPAPSSDTQTSLGRPLGTEPYGNRYQWNGTFATSTEYLRLVQTPQLALALGSGLGLDAELVKYAQVLALVGGETSTEGARPNAATDGLLARNVESTNFGRQRIQAHVPSIDALTGAELSSLLTQMTGGQVDAWIAHLAEGVRDSDRRPGDGFSSRGEFAALKNKGLLTDMTVIIHGTALEREDFAAMRAAPTIRNDGVGDSRGAKLVWSPLSNLLLYGRTANVYEALAENVVVSLGTDWSPSGSRNLLGELKIADIALRDPTLLGSSRALVPELSTTGKGRGDVEEAERALDREIVDMVTRNPALTVRWQDEVGSIEAGKTADLFMITPPRRASRAGLPPSVYRTLIDATERDVHLVLVGGDPLVGDVEIMQRLKPGQFETVAGRDPCLRMAVSVTKNGVPKGDETLADIQQRLDTGLRALGGDRPPPEGGPGDITNTYSYLKQHFTLPFPMTDAQFTQFVLVPIAGLTPGNKLNLERLKLTPLLENDDDFFFDVLGARVSPTTGLLLDPLPPFMLYRSNSNQFQSGVNPFAPDDYENRWYSPPPPGNETFCTDNDEGG